MSNKNSFSKTLRITQLAILSALVILMSFVPFLGYISLGWISFTIIHIPVIIGAAVMGPTAGAVLGGVWGVACALRALISPPSPLDGLFFKNPIVSVIPRILAGLVAGLIFVAVKKLFKSDYQKSHSVLVNSISAGAAALFGTVTNTALVMGALYLCYGSEYASDLGISSFTAGGLIKYILAAFGINGIAEIALAIIITVPVAGALIRFKAKNEA